MTTISIMVSSGDICEIRSSSKDVRVYLFDFDSVEELDDITEKLFEEVYDEAKLQLPFVIHPEKEGMHLEDTN